MYHSQYYTCEQIDERLLQGYLDDYNSQTGQSLTKDQFLTALHDAISVASEVPTDLENLGKDINLFTNLIATEVSDDSLITPSAYKKGKIYNVDLGDQGPNFSEFVRGYQYYIAKVDGAAGDSLDDTSKFETTYSSSEALYKVIGYIKTDSDNIHTQVGYYECDTAGATAAKVIAVANYALFVGGSMKVKFANKNTANDATLNINSQGAKALYYQGERASANNSWDANEVVEIYYDGTSYYANNVNGGSSGVYDVSKEHPTSGPNSDGKFTLEYILNSNNVNELIPVNKRYPGMSIQFVSTSDNKYVQYRYTETYNGNTYEENQKFINTQNWQKQGAEVSVLQNSLMIGNNKQCSVGIEDSSVLFSNTGFIKSDGTIGSNADYVCTDFLPYNGGNILLYGASGTNACLIVYYDKTRTSILGYLNGTQYDNTSVVINSSDIPNGTAYVRVSGHANSMSNCYSNFAFFGEGKVGLELALYLDWGSRNSNLIGYIPNSKRLHTKRIQVPFMLKVKSDYIIKSIMKYNNGAYKSADTINVTQLVCIPNNTYNEVIVNIEKSDNSAITDFDCVDFFVQGIDAIPIDIKAIGLDTYLTNILNIGEFGLKNSGEIALIISNGNLVTFPISIGKKITYKGVELYYNGSNKWTINKDGLQRMVWPERDNALYSYNSGVISQGQVNASWFSKRFKVSVGDFVVIKGSGGSGARLWALTDENNNVIEVAPSGYEAVQYNIVRASSDGYIFVNATKATFEVWITKEMAERFELPIKGMPKLQIDTTADVMVDLSTEIDGVRFYSVYLMQAIIDKFDALITAYPNYVTKTDVVTFINDTLHSTNPLSYPEYANGVTDYHTGDGHVDEYRTYIYKVTLPQTNLGKADQNPRKTILLIGGVHGSELTSQFNCYLFAYNLLHNSIQDNNLFKILSCADVYIVPTLNGYGAVVGTRVNANGVNINRNYPSRLWHAIGTPYNADYTGASAGSEFETQIVMQLVQYLKPDIVLDHHNYWGAAHQLYFEFDGLRSNDCCYRAAVDISQKALKEMPEYFGTKPFILTNDNSIIRGTYEEQGRMPTWLRDYDKNILSCTCEISARINYVDGVNQVATTVPENGTDVFKVGELTLRETIYSFLNMSLAIK